MTDWKDTVQVGYETAEEKLAFRDGKNVGIKKVVAFIEEYPSVYKPSPEALQAKLTEWGIEK